MSIRRGHCHCGAVEFEVDFKPETEDTPYFRCNCSLCSRKGAVLAGVRTAAFKLLQGESSLSVYQWNTMEAKHYFCSRCGIHTHYVPRGGDDEVGFNAACLDGIKVFELGNVPTGNGAKLSVVT
jgi:hypothetical protein